MVVAEIDTMMYIDIVYANNGLYWTFDTVGLWVLYQKTGKNAYVECIKSVSYDFCDF